MKMDVVYEMTIEDEVNVKCKQFAKLVCGVT